MSSKVLVVGAVNVDITASPERPYVTGDSNPATTHLNIGGVGTNIAQNLARLGHAVQLLTVLGDDAFTPAITRHLDALQIDRSTTTIASGLRNNRYIALLDENHDLFVAVNDMPTIDHLDATRIHAHHDVIATSETIVVDNNLHADALAAVFDAARGNYVVVDAVSGAKLPKLYPHLNDISLLKVNAMEYDLLMSDVARRQVVADAVQSGRLELLVSRHGQPFELHQTSGVLTESPIPCPNIVSTSGAGDALLSGYLHGVLTGTDVPTALHYAKTLAYRTLLVHASTTEEVNNIE